MHIVGLIIFLTISSCFAVTDFLYQKVVCPNQVEIGMEISKVRAIRASAFDGPVATSDDGKKIWPTLMEVVDMGKDSQVSYWYLFSNGKLVGVQKTRNLNKNNIPSDVESEAGLLYSRITRALGESQIDFVVRKGEASFAQVQTDVWSEEKSGYRYFYIATTKEITVAVVSPSDFPLDQVFIRPNTKRFPIEETSAQTIKDLPRQRLNLNSRQPKYGESEDRTGNEESTRSEIGRSIDSPTQNHDLSNSANNIRHYNMFWLWGALAGIMVILIVGIWLKIASKNARL